MNLNALMTLSYWIENPQTDFLLGFVIFFLGLLVLFTPTLMRKLATKNKVLKKSIKGRLVWFFPLGGFTIFLVITRFGEIGFLSYRYLLGVVLLATVLYGLFFLLKVYQGVQKRTASIEREREKRGTSQ